MSRKDDRDNRSKQLNPNNDAYWIARGYDKRPHDWDERSTDEEKPRGLRRSAPKPRK